MRLVPIAATMLIKLLRKLGFQPVRQKGSHLILEHIDGRGIPIPIHGGKEIPPQLLKTILKEAKITREELFKLLKEILILLAIIPSGRNEKNVN